MLILYKVKKLCRICFSDKLKWTNLQTRCKLSNNISCLIFSKCFFKKLFGICEPEKSAQIFKHLKEEEIEQLTLEIANTSSVSPQTKEQVLNESAGRYERIRAIV